MAQRHFLVLLLLAVFNVVLSSHSTADELSEYFESNFSSSNMSEQEVRELLVGHWTSHGTGREPIWFIDTRHLNTNYPKFWSNVRKHQSTYDVTEYQLKLNGSMEITLARAEALKVRTKEIQAQTLKNSNDIHAQKRALSNLSGAELEAAQKAMHKLALENGEMKKAARRIGNFARLIEQAHADGVSQLNFVAIQAELYNHDHTISPNVPISASDKKFKLLTEPFMAGALLAISEKASYIVDQKDMSSRPLTRMDASNSSDEHIRIQSYYDRLKRTVDTIWQPRCNALQASASALSKTKVLEHCQNTLSFLKNLKPTQKNSASVSSNETIIGTISHSPLATYRTSVYLNAPISNPKFSSCESFTFINDSGMDLLKLSEMQAQWMDFRIAGHKVKLNGVRKPVQGKSCEFSSLQAINDAGEIFDVALTQYSAPTAEQANYLPPYQNCLGHGGNVEKLKEKLNGMGFLNYCRCMAQHQGKQIDQLKQAGKRIKGYQYAEFQKAAESACLGSSANSQPKKSAAPAKAPVASAPSTPAPKHQAPAVPKAEPAALPQQSIVGCWSDGMSLYVNITADGRSFNGLAIGAWRRGDKPNEFITEWPPIVDKVFLDGSGKRYKSIGLFNIELQAERESGSNGIVGTWRRQDGAVLEYRNDKSVIAGPEWKGVWEQVGSGASEFTVSWPMIERIQLADGGKQYSFVNQGFKGTLKPATGCPVIP